MYASLSLSLSIYIYIYINIHIYTTYNHDRSLLARQTAWGGILPTKKHNQVHKAVRRICHVACLKLSVYS